MEVARLPVIPPSGNYAVAEPRCQVQEMLGFTADNENLYTVCLTQLTRNYFPSKFSWYEQ